MKFKQLIKNVTFILYFLAQCSPLYSNDTLVVTASSLKLRECPNVECAMIGSLMENDNVILLSNGNDKWIKIRSLNGVEGYSLSKYFAYKTQNPISNQTMKLSKFELNALLDEIDKSNLFIVSIVLLFLLLILVIVLSHKNKKIKKTSVSKPFLSSSESLPQQHDKSRSEYSINNPETNNIEIGKLKIKINKLESENSSLKREIEYKNEDSYITELQNNIAALEKIAKRHIELVVSNAMNSITPNNFLIKKKNIEKEFEFCKKNGYIIDPPIQGNYLFELEDKWEQERKKDDEKYLINQARKEIKELQRLERLAKKAEEEERLYNDLLIKAETKLKLANIEEKDTYEKEIISLKEKLNKAIADKTRAMSMAQQTKKGFVYVISNVGSFGENIYKVGMTRRLEPQERVQELSNASVPFPFDIHYLIFSENAPELEYNLHQALDKFRVNKSNFRKEYFKTDLNNIVEAIKSFDYEPKPYNDESYSEEFIISQDISDEEYMDLRKKLDIANN